MTVEELKTLLNELDPDADVWFWDRDQYGNPVQNYVKYVETENGEVQIG